MNDYLLQTKDLIVKYKKQYAVKDLNINIPKGKIYGLLGRDGALVFMTLMPILVVSILQRSLFYPSFILCLFFTFISTFASGMSGVLPFIIPCTAVHLISVYDIQGIYLTIGLATIILCGSIGLGLSIYIFKHQNI